MWSLSLIVVGFSFCLLPLPGYSGLVLLSLGYCVIYFISRGQEDMLPAHSRAVLITGCDSGFGHNVAKLLDRQGVTVFAGVLDELGSGALELKRVGSEKLRVLQLDVTDSEQIKQVHQYIKAYVGEAGLWGIVNNAGILGYLCDGELLPVRIFKKVLAVNFLSGVELTQVFLPLLRRAKGRIVNISSMAGVVPVPGYGAYGASKAAVTLFSGVMRQELSRWGIKVAIIHPASFKTNIQGSRADWQSIQEEILSTLPQDVKEDYGEEYICSMQCRLTGTSSTSSENLQPVLDCIHHALLSATPKALYTPGSTAWLIPFIHRLCPAWLYDIIFTRLIVFDRTQPAGVQSRN